MERKGIVPSLVMLLGRLAFRRSKMMTQLLASPNHFLTLIIPVLGVRSTTIIKPGGFPEMSLLLELTYKLVSQVQLFNFNELAQN